MKYLELQDLDKFFRGALYFLEEKRETVNKLNVFPVPDGDTGTNMYLTLKTAIENLDKKPPKNVKEFGKVICEGALIGGRGNSGVILSQILKGFLNQLTTSKKSALKTFTLPFKMQPKLHTRQS